MPINVRRDEEDGMVEIWTDTDRGEIDGRLIGVGKNLRDARAEAVEALVQDLNELLLIDERAIKNWS